MAATVKTHKRKGRVVKTHQRKTKGFSTPTSSHVGKVSYDPYIKNLQVSFKKNGSTYAYAGVSAQKFAALQSSKSKGTYLHKSIYNKHKTTKLQ
jgi:hypothetical protein